MQFLKRFKIYIYILYLSSCIRINTYYLTFNSRLNQIHFHLVVLRFCFQKTYNYYSLFLTPGTQVLTSWILLNKFCWNKWMNKGLDESINQATNWFLNNKSHYLPYIYNLSDLELNKSYLIILLILTWVYEIMIFQIRKQS